MIRRALHLFQTLQEDVRGAARITADTRSRLRLTADFLLYRPMKLLRPPGFNGERKISVRGGIEITYRLNRGDIWALHEVWIREIYRMPLAYTPEVIVDLGANIGLTALWLAKQYGCTRLIAVEPVRANAALARRNLEQNGICAEVIEAAVGAKDGTALLEETVSSTNSTVAFGKNDAGRKTNDEQPATHAIPVVSMATALRSLPENTPVDLLKMDIEGSEGELLSGDTVWLKRVRALIAEFHPAHADPDAMSHIIARSGLQLTPREIVEENIVFFLQKQPANH